MEEMKIVYLPPGDLTPYAKNAKRHPDEQVQHIANSIREFGFRQPIVVDADNVVVIGHGRLMAAKKLKLEQVPVVRADDLTDEQIKALRLADNKTNESEWDFGLLDSELVDLALDFDMSDFGFDEIPVGVSDTPTAADDDFDPDEPVEPLAKLGDIYQLGRHRLMCGDSTEAEEVSLLMGGQKADMVFTDPPFGVNVKGGKDKGNMIEGDLTQTAIPFSFEIAVNKAMKDKAHLYFCGAEANIQLYQKLFDRYLHILPKHIIWVKNGFVMKQNGYHNQYEIIYYGYKIGSGGLWYGGRKEDEASDVWKIDRDASSTYVHPTQKPVEIPARAIRNSSPVDGLVLDLFGGSGSTLIACEQLGRTCYMMELDPHYVDVIIARWEKLTGEKAVLLNE